MRVCCLAPGIAILALALLWPCCLAGGWSPRVPRDWSFRAEYLGDMSYDQQGSRAMNKPRPRHAYIYGRDQRVVQWAPGRAVIADTFSVFDLDSGQRLHQAVRRFPVDPRSGRSLGYPGHPEARGAYYLFPANAAKSSYELFNNNLNRLTVQYQRTERLEDTELYVYSYQGPAEATGWYIGTFLEAAGNEVMVAEQLRLEYWVEPVTGAIVRITEESTGDWYIDRDSGRRTGYAGAWAGSTTLASVHQLLERAKRRQRRLAVLQVWVPLLMGALGVTLLLWGVLFRHRAVEG